MNYDLGLFDEETNKKVSVKLGEVHSVPFIRSINHILNVNVLLQM